MEWRPGERVSILLGTDESGRRVIESGTVLGIALTNVRIGDDHPEGFPSNRLYQVRLDSGRTIETAARNILHARP
jgi:hypothetical protein